jgi:dolichol-phosphate mannosyltransferase
MIASANQGFEIVYAQRASRTDSFLYVLCTKIFYKIMLIGSKVKFPSNVSDFYLITDKVKNALLQMQESVRYTRGLVFYTGFSKTGVQYDRPNRNAGKSNFNFIKLTIFMFDAITSFTSLPVHLISLIGLILSVLSFVFGLGYIILNVFSGNVFPGWGSLMAVAIFLGSVQILMVGVVAEYIARMNIELKRRPKYFLAEIINE